MKSKTPKHLLYAHRLIFGREKLRRKSHGKAEHKHLAEVRGIFQDRNIVGLGIAEKLTSGKRAGEATLCFYVKEKKAKGKLRSHQMIPPVVSVDGRCMFTDVYPIGRLKAQGNVQEDPIQSGFSVSNDRSSKGGTVGAIVKSGDTFYILSNAHVLAPRAAADPARPINTTYPAFVDTDGMRRIGVLRDIVELAPSGNRADAALAEINLQFIGDIDTTIHRAAIPHSVGDPEDRMTIVANGRTSGPMEGVVRDLHFSGTLEFPGLGLIGFVDQVLCSKYSDDGDSGALVVAKDTGKIVGLHFAGSDKGSLFSPIRMVQDGLSIKFRFL